MKLIVIYGAPGVGKFTVGKALARITGFKLLHNHLTNDLVASLFDFGTKKFWGIVHEYRRDLLERAARSRIKGVIITFVYAAHHDDKNIGAIIARMKKYGGKILFVHLVCDHDVLLKRIKHPSRKLFQKIKTHTILRAVMKRHDIFSDVPYKENITIDNTKLSPQKVAQLIKKQYNL